MLAACNPGKPEIARDAPSVSAAAAQPATAAASAPTALPRAGAALRVLAAASDTDVSSVIRTERLRAKSEGRVLVVYASAHWCEPCKRFDAEIRAGRLDERLGKLTLLSFDADRDAERLASAGYTFRFIPYVALPSADGAPAEGMEATGKGKDAWTALLGKLESWQDGGSR